MVDNVLLYISAAGDLTTERDVLGRAVVDIPTTLGWQIVQSPIRGEAVDLETVTQADLHVVLLGGDIRALIGMEWLTARRSGHSSALFLKEGIYRTMAAESFKRFVEEWSTWRLFKSQEDLRFKVYQLIVDHLLGRSQYYNLSSAEMNKLKEWRDDLDHPVQDDYQELHRVTGESSVILSPERYIPSEGVLLEKPPDPEIK
jgi:hypothetical protein